MAKRRRKAHHKRNAFKHRYRARARKNPMRRRHRHHNPFSVRGLTSSLMPAVGGAAGAIGLDVALAYLPLPAQLSTGWGKVAVQVAGAFGIGLLIGKVAGRSAGHLATAGALTVTAYSALKQALAPTLGTSIKGLSGLADFGDYRPAWPGEYAVGAVPSALEDRPGLSRMGAYMGQSVRYPSARLGRLGAYMRPMGAYMNPAAFIGAPAASPLAAKQRALAGFGSTMDDMFA